MFIIAENEILDILIRYKLPAASKITKIAHSTSALIYRIEFEKQDPLLARVYTSRSVHGKSDFNILSKLFNAGMTVPKPIKFIQSKQASILLMEYLSGPLLGNVINQSDEPTKLLEKYTDTLISINNFNWQPVFRKTKVPDLIKKPDSFVKSIVRERKKDCKAFGLKKEAKGVIKWLEKQRKDIASSKGYFLHSDYHPFNIIVETDGLKVIDWENAQIGDNRMDLGFAAVSASVFHGLDVENFIISRYAKSGLPVNDLDFFIVAEALHRIAKLHNILTPEFSEFKIYKQVFEYLISRVIQITGVDLALQIG